MSLESFGSQRFMIYERFLSHRSRRVFGFVVHIGSVESLDSLLGRWNRNRFYPSDPVAEVARVAGVFSLVHK